MHLTSQQQQGLHGEGFVFALTSAAGLTLAKANLDADGVDWLIGRPGARGSTRSPKIEVQVKSWSNPAASDDRWCYRMRVRHFNALAGPGFEVRRYLVLVMVPPMPIDYARCREDGMLLNYAAYWESLADADLLPDGPEDPQTVTVNVPKRNLLTVETLTALVHGDLAAARS